MMCVKVIFEKVIQVGHMQMTQDWFVCMHNIGHRQIKENKNFDGG